MKLFYSSEKYPSFLSRSITLSGYICGSDLGNFARNLEFLLMKFPINLAFRPDFDTFFSVSGDFVGISIVKLIQVLIWISDYI